VITARVVRGAVLLVCAGGIAGMIVASAADDTTAALTFGLVTAAAVACLMVATAVSGASAPASDVDDGQARRVEDLVQQLVAEGVEESRVRRLVREAVRLGATRMPGGTGPGRDARRTHP
jgi:hypothetical protein